MLSLILGVSIYDKPKSELQSYFSEQVDKRDSHQTSTSSSDQTHQDLTPQEEFYEYSQGMQIEQSIEIKKFDSNFWDDMTDVEVVQ